MAWDGMQVRWSRTGRDEIGWDRMGQGRMGSNGIGRYRVGMMGVVGEWGWGGVGWERSGVGGSGGEGGEDRMRRASSLSSSFMIRVASKPSMTGIRRSTAVGEELECVKSGW